MESGLVGADNYMPMLPWSKYLIESQGYTVKNNIIYQYNKRTIILNKNGRIYISKRTKHIKAVFFIKDKIKTAI